MSDTGFTECSAYLDQLYSIDSSDLNAEGIAEIKINAKCIGDIDIYNDTYNEVMLHFTQENVEIKGTIRLENKGKLTLNLGNYKLFGTSSENLEELVITSTNLEDNSGWIKDVKLDNVLINKGIVKLEGKSIIGRLNIEETLLDIDENAELISHEILVKSVDRDSNLRGKITVRNSFIYDGKCITLDQSRLNQKNSFPVSEYIVSDYST